MAPPKQPITVWNGKYDWQVYRDEAGVYRWLTSDNVPPADSAREFGLAELPGYDADKQLVARDADTRRAIAAYRQAQANLTPEQRAERDYELRAAFGPGATITDVVSGETFRT